MIPDQGSTNIRDGRGWSDSDAIGNTLISRHKRAIIAVARMMLVCIYNMLLNGEESDPVDRESEDRKEEERRAVKAAADDQERMAIGLLASRGYDMSHLGVPA